MTGTDSATRTEAQRTALIDALTEATLPYMPTLEGHMAASARAKALEIVNDPVLLQRFLPLAETIDFTQMTADDTRRFALVVKKIMLKRGAGDDLYEGSPAATLSEAERAAVARVIRQAMPSVMAYMIPGQPANGGELMVDGLMSDADTMQRFLEANKGIDFAALTEEDERRAVAATAKLLVKEKEPETEPVWHWRTVRDAMDETERLVAKRLMVRGMQPFVTTESDAVLMAEAEDLLQNPEFMETFLTANKGVVISSEMTEAEQAHVAKTVTDIAIKSRSE